MNNLNTILTAYAKAPRHSLAKLFINGGNYWVTVTNGYYSQLNYLIGATSQSFDCAYYLPKIKITNSSHTSLELDEVGLKLIHSNGRSQTVTYLEKTYKENTDLILRPLNGNSLLDYSKFIDDCKVASKVASKDNTSLVLTTVNIKYRDDSADYKLAATDGHRLVRVGNCPDSSVNTRILAEDVNMLSLLKSSAFNLNMSGLWSPTFNYKCTLEGRYPDYDLIIPKTPVHTVGIKVGSIKEINSALKSVKKLVVKCEFQAGLLKISTLDSLFNFEWPINFCNDFTAYFNAGFLLDALSNSNTVVYHGEDSAVMFYGKNTNHLLMPVKIRI